jgi:hypothetical protein
MAVPNAREELSMSRSAKSGEPAVTEMITQMIPMELRVADHLVDETGEWEVIGKPFSTGAGRVVHVRVRKVDRPDSTDLRSWGAHERLQVKRAGSRVN